MNKTSKALKILKRNLYGTIVLALILPAYISEVMKEDPKIIAIVGTAMILLSVTNLSYTSKVEKALKEGAI